MQLAQTCTTWNRVINDQGRAIAYAIRRWEQRVALAGAELPEVSKAFALAVVNAADSDWLALGGDPSGIRPIQRTRSKILQILVLVIPVCAIAGIVFAIRPLPTEIEPLLLLLGGIECSQLLRLLGLSADLDPGLKISQLLRMPK